MYANTFISSFVKPIQNKTKDPCVAFLLAENPRRPELNFTINFKPKLGNINSLIRSNKPIKQRKALKTSRTMCAAIVAYAFCWRLYVRIHIDSKKPSELAEIMNLIHSRCDSGGKIPSFRKNVNHSHIKIPKNSLKYPKLLLIPRKIV